MLNDPFSGETIDFDRLCCGSDIHIDHLVPLSYAWQMGADQWSDDKRLDFANDPLNLAAVSGPLNQSKGDSDLASWLPPNKAIRCAYAVRFAAVSIKYALANTDANRQMMFDQCGGRNAGVDPLSQPSSPPPTAPPVTSPPPTTIAAPAPVVGGSDCDPNYDPCVPNYNTHGDVNCADLPGSVRVVGPHDPHGLDRDGDGRGCE